MPDPTPFERFAELQAKLNGMRDAPLADELAMKRYVATSEELFAAARTLLVDKMLAERKRLLLIAQVAREVAAKIRRIGELENHTGCLVQAGKLESVLGEGDGQ